LDLWKGADRFTDQAGADFRYIIVAIADRLTDRLVAITDRFTERPGTLARVPQWDVGCFDTLDFVPLHAGVRSMKASRRRYFGLCNGLAPGLLGKSLGILCRLRGDGQGKPGCTQNTGCDCDADHAVCTHLRFHAFHALHGFPL